MKICTDHDCRICAPMDLSPGGLNFIDEQGHRMHRRDIRIRDREEYDLAQPVYTRRLSGYFIKNVGYGVCFGLVLFVGILNALDLIAKWRN